MIRLLLLLSLRIHYSFLRFCRIAQCVKWMITIWTVCDSILATRVIVAHLSVVVDLATLTSVFVECVFDKTDIKMKYEIWNGSLTAVARISSNHLVYEYMRRIHPPQICSCGCVQASAGDRTVCGSQSDRQTDRQIHTANGFMVAQPKNNNKW